MLKCSIYTTVSIILSNFCFTFSFFYIAYFIWHYCFGLYGVVYFSSYFDVQIFVYLFCWCAYFSAIFAGNRLICFCLSTAISALRFLVLFCSLLLEMLCIPDSNELTETNIF